MTSTQDTLHLILGNNQGKILVRYDPGPDTYTVTYGKVTRINYKTGTGGDWKEFASVNDVYADSIVQIIDRLLSN